MHAGHRLLLTAVHRRLATRLLKGVVERVEVEGRGGAEQVLQVLGQGVDVVAWGKRSGSGFGLGCDLGATAPNCGLPLGSLATKQSSSIV